MTEEKKRGRKRNKDISMHYDGVKRRATEHERVSEAIEEYNNIANDIVNEINDRSVAHVNEQKSQNRHWKRTLKNLKVLGAKPGMFFTALLEEFGIERKEVKANRIPGSDNPDVEKYLTSESEIVFYINDVKICIARIGTYYTWNLGCEKIDLRNLAIHHPHLPLEHNIKGFKASSVRYAIDSPFPTSGFFRLFKNGMCGIEGPICENAANLLAITITASLVRANLPVGFFNFRFSNQMFSSHFGFPINLTGLYAEHPLIFELPNKFPAGCLRPKGPETNPTIMVFETGKCVFIGVDRGEEVYYCTYVYEIVKVFRIESTDPIVQAFHKGDRRHPAIKGRTDSIMYLESAPLTTESLENVLHESNALTMCDLRIVAQETLRESESRDEYLASMKTLFPDQDPSLFLEYMYQDVDGDPTLQLSTYNS